MGSEMCIRDRDNGGMISKPNYSEHTAKLIDDEVRTLVDECYKLATETLENNLDILHAMKEALMEYETIDSEQVDDLMNRRKVRPPKDWDNTASNNESDDLPEAEASSNDSPIGGTAEEK